MLPFLMPLLSPVLDKVLSFIPDPAAKAKAALEAQQAMQDFEMKAMAMISEQNKAQAAINVEEAKSASLFIAGWRPCIGWCCGASFAWVYVLQPMLTFILAAVNHPVVLPTLDFSQMSTVLMGMLGLAGMRSMEKVKDAEGNR